MYRNLCRIAGSGGLRKQAYVVAVRSFRGLLGRVGRQPIVDRWASRSRTRRWIRSWLAIYDLDDLRSLDLPLWTVRAPDGIGRFLENRSAAHIFEWGSGASTFWLARRAMSVNTVWNTTPPGPSRWLRLSRCWRQWWLGTLRRRSSMIHPLPSEGRAVNAISDVVDATATPGRIRSTS
jgi:hypothetical protein